MAVTKVYEKWSGLNASRDAQTLSQVAKWSAQRGYTVVFDSVDPANQIAALSASADGVSVPNLSAAFDGTYTGIRLHRKRAAPLGRNPYLWEVICEYWGENSPLTLIPERSWDDECKEEECDDDADGNAVVNTLNDPITGWTRDFHDGIYTFTRNEAADTYSRPNSYRGSVNTDIVTLNGYACAAGALLMKKISGQQIVDDDYYYWKTAYRVYYRADGWEKRVLNAGNYYWTGRTLGGKKEILPCVCTDGITPRRWPLNADGTLWVEGTAQHWLSFKRNPEIAWATLGLS